MSQENSSDRLTTRDQDSPTNSPFHEEQRLSLSTVSGFGDAWPVQPNVEEAPQILPGIVPTANPMSALRAATNRPLSSSVIRPSRRARDSLESDDEENIEPRSSKRLRRDSDLGSQDFNDSMVSPSASRLRHDLEARQSASPRGPSRPPRSPLRTSRIMGPVMPVAAQSTESSRLDAASIPLEFGQLQSDSIEPQMQPLSVATPFLSFSDTSTIQAKPSLVHNALDSMRMLADSYNIRLGSSLRSSLRSSQRSQGSSGSSNWPDSGSTGPSSSLRMSTSSRSSGSSGPTYIAPHFLRRGGPSSVPISTPWLTDDVVDRWRMQTSGARLDRSLSAFEQDDPTRPRPVTTGDERLQVPGVGTDSARSELRSSIGSSNSSSTTTSMTLQIPEWRRRQLDTSQSSSSSQGSEVGASVAAASRRTSKRRPSAMHRFNPRSLGPRADRPAAPSPRGCFHPFPVYSPADVDIEHALASCGPSAQAMADGFIELGFSTVAGLIEASDSELHALVFSHLPQMYTTLLHRSCDQEALRHSLFIYCSQGRAYQQSNARLRSAMGRPR